MFIKNGDDPKSKILSIVNSDDNTVLDEEIKVALDKVKLDAEKNESAMQSVEKN